MMPKVIIHDAVSLDGRTTGFDVDMGRFYRLVSTWQESVTLAGADTILGAPEGRVREKPTAVAATEPRGRDGKPLLAVIDSRGRVGCWGMLRDSGFWRGVLAIGAEQTPVNHVDYLRRCGVEFRSLGRKRVDLRRALIELRRRHRARVVRLESGGRLNRAMLELGLVTEVSLLVHPVIVGGSGPVFAAGGGPVRLRLVTEQKLAGGLVWLRYRIGNTPAA
jgi:2,5-diamino-6-(ribosylamino)-4(3H)-pyrimidinone 5'-phosphate reductase